MPTTELAKIGDSPFWDKQTNSVYYYDLLSNRVFRYCLSTDETYTAQIKYPLAISFFIPMNCTDNNRFIVGAGESAFVIQWDGKSKHTKKLHNLFSVNLPKGSRFNHAAVDSNCGIYFGSFNVEYCDASPTQGFYYYTKKYGVKCLFSNTRTTTGLTFDEKTKTLYVLDGCTQIITAFTWENGNLCNLISINFINLSFIFN